MEDQQLNLPKKILRIEDLTFELPDDFEGDLQNALQLLVDYIGVIFGGKQIVSMEEGLIPPSIFEDPEGRRVKLQYGIFERGEDGEYHLT